MIKYKSGIRTFLLSSTMIIHFLSSSIAFSQTNEPGNIMYRPKLGIKKMLFIRVNYLDDNRIVLTAQEAQDHAENLRAIFTANSYGALDFEIDITPVLTMPQPITFYRGFHNRLSFVRLRADAIKMAEDAGFKESDYEHEIIFTKKAWPQVQNGIGGVNLRTCYIMKNSPTLSAHELGHTFDWKHANFWWVTSANPIDTTGEVIDYGDRFDIMGDISHFHHFNPWYKLRVGWILPEEVKTVTESGNFTIRALESDPQDQSFTGYYALQIRRNANTEYWVYYRTNEDLANTGALISQMEPNNRSQALLLDMNPSSKINKHNEYQDAALLPGKTIQDQEAGIELTVLDKFSDSLHVQVVVPGSEIDNLPIIDILNPKPGVTVQGAIDYEATAYDPDVGTVNGAGIDTVTFILSYSEGDETLLDLTPKRVSLKQVTSPPYIFHVETDSLQDEVYRIIVFAKSKNGAENKAIINHIIDNTGPSTSTDLTETENKLSHFQLKQNYPNPFNPATIIDYSIPDLSVINLSIFDISGRKIKTLVNKKQEAGSHQIIWDGLNEAGQKAPSGMYFYHLKTGSFSEIRKMILLK